MSLWEIIAFDVFMIIVKKLDMKDILKLPIVCTNWKKLIQVLNERKLLSIVTKKSHIDTTERFRNNLFLHNSLQHHYRQTRKLFSHSCKVKFFKKSKLYCCIEKDQANILDINIESQQLNSKELTITITRLKNYDFKKITLLASDDNWEDDYSRHHSFFDSSLYQKPILRLDNETENEIGMIENLSDYCGMKLIYVYCIGKFSLFVYALDYREDWSSYDRNFPMKYKFQKTKLYWLIDSQWQGERTTLIENQSLLFDEKPDLIQSNDLSLQFYFLLTETKLKVYVNSPRKSVYYIATIHVMDINNCNVNIDTHNSKEIITSCTSRICAYPPFFGNLGYGFKFDTLFGKIGVFYYNAYKICFYEIHDFDIISMSKNNIIYDHIIVELPADYKHIYITLTENIISISLGEGKNYILSKSEFIDGKSAILKNYQIELISTTFKIKKLCLKKLSGKESFHFGIESYSKTPFLIVNNDTGMCEFVSFCFEEKKSYISLFCEILFGISKKRKNIENDFN